MCIAGFDPSGGAGILADIKTFEQHRCLGFAIQTANTVQNEDKFVSPNWISQDLIFEQLMCILEKHQFDFVKIGLIEDLDFLEKLIQLEGIKDAKIVWDPVLSASAGFNFDFDLEKLEKCLKSIYIVTPNWNEAKLLSKSKDAIEGAKQIAKHTKVCLKGGHNNENLGKDYLFLEDKTLSFNPKVGNYSEKHGSGCVFASALTSNLRNGYPIQKAVLRSKRYIERFLASSSNKLGKHNF